MAKNYFNLTKREKQAVSAIVAIAPVYNLVVNPLELTEDPFKRRCTAAIMLGLLAHDLQDLAIDSMSAENGYAAGFGVISTFIQKISVLL